MEEYFISRPLIINIIYDKIASDELLQSELNSINISQGLIIEGQIIVNKGEIANLPTYSFYARLGAVHSQEPMSGVTIKPEENGSVEIAPNIGLAEAIVDIVSTGGTLFKNNLVEKEIILKSEAVLAVSPTIEEAQKVVLDKIKFRIESVLKGQSSKYVLLNAPNDSLEAIINLLPGMKSPTVLPLAESGWSSVHSVIDRYQFWDIIDDLKALGAQGILICPIEKMVL